MLGIKNEWQILKTGKRSDFLTIAAITGIFIFVVAINIMFIFNMTANQTEEIGEMQLENIRSELQETINNAERMTLHIAIRAEQMIAVGASKEEFESFFIHEQQEHKNVSNGECFNVYIANKDWAIIPAGTLPDDYVATERNWYKGAAQNPGKIYITEPYIDAAGHGLCFTVSMMLSDKKNVIALDFNFSNTQNSIRKMDKSKDHTALIVTKDGMIIGCQNEKLLGENVRQRLPEYQRILDTILNATSHDSFQANIDGLSDTIFFSEMENGWIMILSVNNSALYHEDYRQLMLNSVVNLWMILIIVFYYLKNMKNRLQAQKALHVKEEFLQGLSKELNSPLKKILKLSNMNSTGSDDLPTESAAKIREAALKLSDMINNLLSFSTIVNERDKNLKKHADKNLQLSKISRSARQRIIVVLTIALIFRICISVYTNIGWGDTKMNREVDIYEHRLSDWVIEQKTILGMLANTISRHPHIIENYSDGVKFLDDVTKKYPGISACYLANPNASPQFIMNTNWVPTDPTWNIANRPWYIETEKSTEKFTVSTPYFDSNTGNYCVTIAQSVHRRDGDFLGVFAIDFYLDCLIQILDNSYTDSGYAFLVDKHGKIINHPYANYQMTTDKMVDISETEYNDVYTKGNDFMLKDFSGNYMTCIAKKSNQSGFTIVVANSWYKIYGQVILFAISDVIIYIVCIGLIIALINSLLLWQTGVQKKLKDASTAALHANQAKSQFLAQMSHEIRTPINAVLGMNEMILRESNDRDILEYAENISSAGKTLLNLINSILDFSKIEDGKMQIIAVRYDTVSMIDDLVNMIYDKANQKQLSLITKIDPKLPRTLYGDDMRIKQVITNILTNAVKYTDQEGTVTLTMSSGIIDDDNLILCVSVEDTGIGIREEDIEKLFQSFIRLDETKNKNIEGTGLGISIVKELLRMMNSQLEVSSVYGKGSNFSFKLLQKIIDKTPIGIYGERQSEHRIKGINNEKFIRAPGARVLAVDDTSMNLKVINGLLKRNQIVPDLADSGERCLQLAKKYFYHIIFLDHMMPKMDGIETLNRLKKMSLPAETKIIALTANAISGARDIYFAKGFDDYLGKPIDVNDLEAILAKYLPPEIVINEDEAQEELPTAQIDEPKPLTEKVDADKFSEEERRRFESLCPSIDLDAALANCVYGKEFFAEMAEEFINGDKSNELDAALTAGDLKEYRIISHALKGTALVIGAVELSDKAKAQESLANDGKLNELKQNHGDLITTYEKVREELKAWLAPEDNDDTERRHFESICPSIDLDTALSNCMDSKEFFAEMAEEFINDDRSNELDAALTAGDLKEYRIIAHALKGTSLVIGAVELSDKAKAQESLANDGKLNELKQNHGDLITTYETVREELKAWLAPEDNDDTERRRFESICPSIDLDTALSNCMDSKEFFAEMAEEFINGDRSNELDAALTAGDLKEYRIIAHALKGTALVIGAVELSNKAKAQESLANDGKLDELKQNHGNLIQTYKEVCEELGKWLEGASCKKS